MKGSSSQTESCRQGKTDVSKHNHAAQPQVLAQKRGIKEQTQAAALGRSSVGVSDLSSMATDASTLIAKLSNKDLKAMSTNNNST